MAVLGEQIVINARLVIKTLQEAGGDKFQKVAVSLCILAKEQQVVAAAHPRLMSGSGCSARFSFVRLLPAVVPAAFGNVYFAADDGFDAPSRRLVIKIRGGEHITVVGDGNRGHAPARSLLHQFCDIAGAIEKTEVCVKMKMNELRLPHVASF